MAATPAAASGADPRRRPAAASPPAQRIDAPAHAPAHAPTVAPADARAVAPADARADRPRLRVAVLASGRGSNLAALHRACAEGLVDASVVAVLSDRPAPCLDLARSLGLPAIALPPREGEPVEDHDARLADALRAQAPDLVVLAGYMRIVGPRTLAVREGRVVNLHPSLLPAFPGARGVRDALRAGVRVAGCTTHVVTPELDAGPILLQAATAVRADDSRESLAARIHALEHQILPRTVQLYAEGRVRVADGKASIAPGPSWRGRVPLLPDALYPEAF